MKDPRIMSDWVGALQRRFYPTLENRWDDIAFRRRILEHIKPSDTVLDLGAGRGFVPQMNIRGQVASVCGLDPTEQVLENPYLDEARTGSAEAIPWPENTFDVIFSNNVLEHLPNPLAVLKEVRRTLKPGGIFLAKTPNRFHYVALASALTPHWFHEFFHRHHQTDSGDVFPTCYRANSLGRLKSLAADAELIVEFLDTIEGRPEYLRFSAPTYLIGIFYERLVNSSGALARFRVILLGGFRKQGK